MSGSSARSARYGQRPPLTAREALSSRHDADCTVDGGDGPAAARWRRTTRANDRDGLDTTEVLAAVFGNPDLYRLAALVPDREDTKPGRPRDYPHWALLAYGVLASHYRSHRRVHAAMRVPANWTAVLGTVAATAGPQAVASLRPAARLTGPSRNHWSYWLRTHKHLWSDLNDAYTPMAVEQAVEQGLLDPAIPVSLACPDQRTTVYGDGKVMSSPVRRRPERPAGRHARTAKEAPAKRTDPASAFWPEGGDGGQDAHGTKLVFSSVRGPGHLNRVCLTMGLQRKGGPTEADIAVEQIARIKRLAGDGVRAAAWDGALSHKHIDKIMSALGLVVLSPVKAKSNPDGVRSGTKDETRVEKEHHIDTVTRRTADGPCEHRLYARGGRLGQKIQIADRPDAWQPLPIDRIEHRPGKTSHRWYHLLTIPCDTNGDHHGYRVPLVQSAADTSKGLLRSEYLRQVPPDTKGYERAYGTRPAAESDNSLRERRYTWHRLPAYGADAQCMVMLGGNILDNSISRYLHRHRQQADQPAA